jgi:hypothetical protein
MQPTNRRNHYTLSNGVVLTVGVVLLVVLINIYWAW